MKHFNIACGVVIILYLIISCNSKPYNVCVSSPKFHVITSINQKKFPLNEKTLKKIDFLNLPVGDGRDTCLLPPKNHEEYLLVATFYEYQDDYSVIKLIGYSQNKISHNCCEYDEIRFHPDFLKLYSSYVLFYKMNQFYLNEKNFKYVNDGARSISHNTNIQQFLIEKFKFRKAYCKLHVINLRGLSLVIKFLYPFKGIIKRVNLNFFLKLSVILEQEKIVRSFEKR